MCVGTYCSKFHWHTLNVLPDTAWITVIIPWLVGRKQIVYVDWNGKFSIRDSCATKAKQRSFKVAPMERYFWFAKSICFYALRFRSHLIWLLTIEVKVPDSCLKPNISPIESLLLTNEQLRVNDRGVSYMHGPDSCKRISRGIDFSVMCSCHWHCLAVALLAPKHLFTVVQALWRNPWVLAKVVADYRITSTKSEMPNEEDVNIELRERSLDWVLELGVNPHSSV
jgi:hypothetical protein